MSNKEITQYLKLLGDHLRYCNIPETLLHLVHFLQAIADLDDQTNLDDQTTKKITEIPSHLSDLNLTKEEILELLNTPLGCNKFNFNVRAMNIFSNANIKTVGQLIEMSELQLRKFRGCGKGTIDEIIKEVEKIGLSLRPRQDRWSI